MKEASKTNKYRSKDFFDTYFSGDVLDIGAGNDLVCPHARRFDREDGDANFLDDYFPPESFDTVNSSHCLEHMNHPVQTLARWWKLVKVGGYMIIVVPDEDLYEQGLWPSFGSNEHKSTFRLNKPESWSPVSYDIEKLCSDLPGAKVISAQQQSQNYDHSLAFPRHLTPQAKRYTRGQRRVFNVLKKLPGGLNLVKKMQIKLIEKGYPFDQTRYDALAQIEVIVQKV